MSTSISSNLKRKNSGPVFTEMLRITPLGAGNEVGRSCILIEYRGKTVMLDCGIHPAHNGIAALPYFDEVDPSTIDLLLVTHFHLDHAAALPYFLAKTDFNGRIFMTHPTKSIYKLILQDFVKVSSIASSTGASSTNSTRNLQEDSDNLYDEADLLNSMDRIETVNFHQVLHVNGIKFQCYNAGHVLGAAMFMMEIDGVKILYTGDYSRKSDRHLTGAEIPDVKPDVLIIESTYGTQTLQPIQEREKRFTDLVHQIIERGGRCLIPVFALGRAQELLLILDEYQSRHQSLRGYPIYYASSLAKKCMSVYQTYTNMMNSRIQKQFETSNSFVFRHVRYLKGFDDFHDVGPSVVFASPGMLQNGFSRQLFEEQCVDSKNGVIIPGYSVEGTLAKTISMEPSEIETMSGQELPLNMSVHYVTFSAHADYSETNSFVDDLKPPHIILVHGDVNEMNRLNKALLNNYKERNIQISMPGNCQTVELEFRSEKIAKTIGTLAARQPEQGEIVSGLVVVKDYSLNIMSAEDLGLFTPLTMACVEQSLKIPFKQSFEFLRKLVSQIYEVSPTKSIQFNNQTNFGDNNTILFNKNKKLIDDFGEFKNKKEGENGFENTCEDDKIYEISVYGGAVRLDYYSKVNYIMIYQNSSPVNDMISDSLVSLLMTVDVNSSEGVAKELHSPICDQHSKESQEKEKFKDSSNASIIRKVLDNHYGSNRISFDGETRKFCLKIDDCDVDFGDGRLGEASDNSVEASIYVGDDSLHVETENSELRKHLEYIMNCCRSFMFPIRQRNPLLIKDEIHTNETNNNNRIQNTAKDINKSEDKSEKVEDKILRNETLDVDVNIKTEDLDQCDNDRKRIQKIL